MASKISIIIPVYNLEKCITYTLDSVLRQTYTDWEAIIVDDGSRDGSRKIIEAYAEKDKRIRYIHQENGGVAKARNTGLENVTGEYVAFVDGDDLLHPQALEVLMRAEEETDADIVAAGYTTMYGYSEPFVPVKGKTAAREVDYREYFNVQGDTMISKVVWSKLFKSSVACRARFPEGMCFSEDQVYKIRIMMEPVRIVYLDEALYGYIQREGSACHSAFSIKAYSKVAGLEALYQEMGQCENEYLKGFVLMHIYLALFQVRMNSVGTEYEKEVHQNCRKIGKRCLGPWLKNRTNSLAMRVAFVLFWASEKVYEMYRIHQDPTMKEYLQNQRGQ